MDKSYQVRNVCNRFTKNRIALYNKQLSTIYKSYIMYQMEYCSPMWVGTGQTVLLKNIKVEIKCSVSIISFSEKMQI